MAVSFVERIGHRTVVHLGAGAHSAKMTAHSAFVAALGSALRLRARAGGLRLFDQSSGLALVAE